jgi:hypothetical protein
VVLGDSNLNLDLPFGVQSLAIEKALAHEDYDTTGSLHNHDIGEFGVVLNKDYIN